MVKVAVFPAGTGLGLKLNVILGAVVFAVSVTVLA